MDYAKKLVADIARGRINKNETSHLYNAILDEANTTINTPKSTKSRKKWKIFLDS